MATLTNAKPTVIKSKDVADIHASSNDKDVYTNIISSGNAYDLSEYDTSGIASDKLGAISY